MAVKRETHALVSLLRGLNYTIDPGKICESRIDETGTLMRRLASHVFEGTSEYTRHSARLRFELNVLMSSLPEKEEKHL